jgi:hypothetical protein
MLCRRRQRNDGSGLMWSWPGQWTGWAEFDCAMITARIRAGVDRAKATGVTKNGKPTGRPRTDAATEQAIRDQLAHAKYHLSET